MPSKETKLSHIKNCLRFFTSNPEVFFGIGRTGAWTDEASPPTPAGTETTLDTPIGYKKASTYKLVVLDNTNGTIEYRGSKYREITSETAIAEGCTLIYLYTKINDTDLPLVQYRQVGIFTELVRTSGAAGLSVLLPAQVQSVGILNAIDNRKVTTRQTDQYEELSILLQF